LEMLALRRLVSTMAPEQQKRSSSSPDLAARDLYLASTASSTLVTAVCLAAARCFDGSALHALLSALCGAAFGSMPIVVLGIGALAALGTSSSRLGRAVNQARMPSLFIIILASTVPGLVVALAAHVLYVAS